MIKLNEHDMNSLPVIFIQILGKVLLSLKNWIITIPISLYITSFVDILLMNTSHQELLLPLVVGAITLVVYFIVVIFDFLIGLQASKHLDQDISSKRLWRTVFKITSVVLINISLSIFASIFVILNVPIVATSFTILIPALMLTIVLFEIHSIGENFEKIHNYRPKHFKIIERLAKILEEGVFTRIKKYFE